jgi:hypothetical protein
MLPCFNTSGPCVPGEHYMLSPARRFRHVMHLIDERKYFTLHAGRQTGKSTAAQWLVDRLNAGDRYRALWVDVQIARGVPDPLEAFIPVLGKLDTAMKTYLPDVPRPDREALLRDPRSCVLEYLRDVSGRVSHPLVVLVDEADCLVGEAMVSFLTQLRDGYVARSKLPFPHSVALIGQRQVRDYALSEQGFRAVAWLGSASPFNITAEAATLEPFTREEVCELLQQHTDQTGQRFEPEAVERVWYLSQGHPWLVNAMADQVVNRDVEDRAVAVTAEHVEAAKETIIVERRTHIDSLLARLREDRVRRILEPMLAGGETADDVLDDDFAYVCGLGLVRAQRGRFEIANPVYREVVPRALTYVRQMQINQDASWYLRADGGLDMPKLMAGWQKFWRKDGHLAAAGFAYREAGPHLMLMAFLQRIVNSGGRVEREYGLGRGALDLMLFWRDERHAIEVKLRRDTETEQDALEQIGRYLDSAGLREGWLVMFDLRKELSWEDRLYVRVVESEGKRVHLVGC